MIEIDDETLMAFADGELDATAAAEVRDALDYDAALQMRLEKLRDADGLLRAAISPGSDIPSRFTQLLKPAPALKFRRAWVPAGAALAAGLAVWMMGVVLSGPAAWLRQTDQGLAVAGPLAEAATRTPSGTSFEVGTLIVQPVVSFTAADGRPCRDLHLRNDDRAARFIACRDVKSGNWLVEAMANVPNTNREDTYRPAGAQVSPVIDSALARLGGKEPMDAKAETDAIARNWTVK